MSNIFSKLPALKGRVRENAQLAKMCWFGVGGEVDYLFQPADVDDLACFLKNKPGDLPYFVFGVGSNIIIKDTGFRGVAIRLGRGFNYISYNNGLLTAGGATLDLNVALFARDNAVEGLEFLSGIPGTIGGAIAMNAGAYGKEIKDVLVAAKAVGDKGEIVNLTPEDMGLAYRKNNIAKEFIFTEATFAVKQGNPEEIVEKIKGIQEQRGSTQPVKSKTGGSTFKNPSEKKAWQLIDEAGCRGLKIGGAQVSDMHCNFFINTGDATAQDLLDLVKTVKERVYKNSGVTLEEEIKVIG